MLVAPKEGESHTKKIAGDEKPWYWCPGNGAHKARWVRHKPEDCKGKDGKTDEGKEDGDKKSPKSESGKEESGKKKVAWTSGMLAALRRNVDESDNE